MDWLSLHERWLLTHWTTVVPGVAAVTWLTENRVLVRPGRPRLRTDFEFSVHSGPRS